MKKIRFFLTALLAVFSALQIQARNVGDFFTGYIPGTTPKQPDNVTYQITSIDPNNLTVNIWKTSRADNVTFPATVVDSTGTVFKVTSFVTDRAFTNMSAITSITLPEGLTRIGISPLRGASSLTTINLPSTLRTIDSGAAFYATQKLTTFNFPNGSPYYKVGTDGCLYSIAADTLFAYPAGRANNSNNPVTFTVPNTVKVISRYAFWGCWYLTKVILGMNVEEIGENFLSCTSLAAFEVNPYNTTYSASNGMLLNKAGDRLILFPAAKAITNGTLTLPATITKLENQSFNACRNLVHIILPGVKKWKEFLSMIVIICKTLQSIPLLKERLKVLWDINIQKELSLRNGFSLERTITLTSSTESFTAKTIRS